MDYGEKALLLQERLTGNMVAVVTDGSAVKGLGNIGSKAAMPVMEEKALLFKRLADIDALPICLDSRDIGEIVNTVRFMSPSFVGIHLEDIAAPRCYEVEDRLKRELEIPVFHNDQHGTAIVVAAALINALKVVDKDFDKVNTVINGIGSAGSAIARLLIQMGIRSIVLCGRQGILYPGDEKNDFMQEGLARFTNPEGIKGTLADAFEEADIFIGVSAPNIVSQEMVSSMSKDSIVLALANPVPEIGPWLAIKAGARVVGTGRPDYKNQVNNVLAFPGLFRGVLDAGVAAISEDTKIAAARAIASVISDDEISEDYILPLPFDERVVPAVAKAVSKTAVKSGKNCQ
ncbi:MAG TPA: NADP-dependent malic enzyme [Bacillota bacterium]|nr:NADP-dependent malic enzyme [Bacillota bacterium]